MNYLQRARQPIFGAMSLTLLLAIFDMGAWAQERVETEVKRATVVVVQGNHVVVQMQSGEIKDFNVPDDFRFIVNGREISVHELKPGTRLSRTITTVTRPETVTTTEVKRGTVWRRVGNTVHITHENGETKKHVVPGWQKFMVDGQERTVYQLRKGDRLTATIVSEEEVVVSEQMRSAVTGRAPAAPAARPTASPAAAAPAARPTAAAKPEPQSPAASLPRTGSPLPLIGLFGVLALVGTIGLKMVRVFLS